MSRDRLNMRAAVAVSSINCINTINTSNFGQHSENRVSNGGIGTRVGSIEGETPDQVGFPYEGLDVQ